MSSLPNTPLYDHIGQQGKCNDNANFSSSDEYERHSQYSPGSMEKAPSFIPQMLQESNEQDTVAAKIAPSSPPTSTEDKHVWTKQEVELLLDLYETYKEQLKDPRVRKTKIWEDIAQIIRDRLESDVNGSQCNQKFRNLKADFQKVVEHNGRPGTFKRVCKYYERLASILSYPHRQMNMNFRVPHMTHPKVEHYENIDLSRPQIHQDTYYVNGNTSPSPNKINKKRKSQDGAHYSNSYISPDSYYPKKIRKPCNCECSNEIHTLRESLERINNYIVTRAAHEEERIRRVEEQHREKMLAVGRFLDIFKDFIHKMT